MSGNQTRHIGLALALILAPIASADTNVSGTISTSTTWTLANSPYVVTGAVFISGTSTPVLTVQPGVTVKFRPSTYIQVGSPSPGQLIANGTPAQPILFTTDQVTVTAGYYYGVSLSSGVQSQLSYLTIEGAGKSSTQASGLKIFAGNHTIDHVTLRTNSYSGLMVAGGNPTVTNSAITGTTVGDALGVDLYSPANLTISGTVITNNAGAPFAVRNGATLSGVTGMTLSPNGVVAIRYRSSAITVSETWSNYGLPYYLDTLVSVAAATTPVLTIQPGVTVKFRPSTYIQVGSPSPGQLIANGTPAQPILFTTDQVTVTAGYYYGVSLSSGVQSQLSYLTIEGAGKSSTQASGLKIFAGNHTIDHVTLRTNSYSGLMVAGGNPTVTNSAITGTTVGDALGVDLYSPANLTISGTVITNNAGAPFAVRNGATLSGVTGMTLSPNGVVAIRYRSSAITVSETWSNYGLPYYLDTLVSVAAATTPVLTIQPGVTVKFRPSTYIQVGSPSPGQLIANGTPAQPILFTTDQVTVTAGYYYGVSLSSGVQSQLSYLTIEGAGKSSTQASGLKIFAGNHTIDHVTLRTNSYSGLMIAGGTPVVTNSTISGVTGAGATGVSANSGVCSISSSTITGVAGAGITRAAAGSVSLANSSITGNTTGFNNQSPSTPQTAALNFWGTADGPSGSGPGSGQPVSAGVSYEPWLSASPSTPQYIATFAQTNRTFNPNVGVNSVFNFTTSLAGNWTLQILTSIGTVIRTFSGSGASGTATWDGKNDGGTPQANGAYTFQLSSTTAGGQSATPAQGFAILDTTLQVGFTGLAVSQTFFSPNGDSVQDTTALTGTVTPSGATWTVNVRNAINAIVRTYTGSAPTLSVTWDGKNGSGAVQPDGPYAFEAIATYEAASDTSTLGTTLDNTVPTSVITAPPPSQIVSNVYQNGATDFGVIGTASDINITSWTLDYGAGSAPASWTTLGTSTSGVSSGLLGTWSTGGLANGLYTDRLRAWDKAGNLATATVIVTVGNFILTQSAQQQINAATGETITYTSVLPVTLTETLTIRNEAGQTVRTLFDGSRAAGSYVDSWDGKGPSGQSLPSGGYLAAASTVAGSSVMTWDQSSQYINEQNNGTGQVQIGSLDPLDNQPLTVTYSLTRPSRVSMFLRSGPGEIIDSCSPPQFCVFYNRYEESGQHTEHWAGVDSTGAPWGTYPTTLLVVTRRDLFPKNAVVVLGTGATLTGLVVTPPRVNSGDTLGVNFDLTTYQNVSSSLTVTFLNQSSLSVLRTITLPAQAPGHVTVNWDTRANNGAPVAPGRYVITISGQDSTGNQLFGQSLASVEVLR